MTNRNGKPVVWHQSGIRLFERCPHAWDLAYLRGEPEIVPEAWRVGSENHLAVQQYAMGLWRDGKRPLKRDEDLAAQIGRAYCEETQEMIRWFAKEVPFEWGNVAALAELTGGKPPLEQALSAELPCGETFAGKLDLVLLREVAEEDDPYGDAEDGLVQNALVVDWKSRVSDAMLAEPGAPLQLRAYAWLLCKALGRTIPVNVTYIEIMPTWMRRPRQQIVWRVSDNDIQRTEADLDSWVRRIQTACADTHGLDPTPGAACYDCCYALACEVGQSRTVEELTSVSPGERADLVSVIEGQLKLLKKMVKDEPAGRYEWRAKTYLDAKDLVGLRSLAAKHEVDVDARLNITPTGLQELIDAMPPEAQAEAFASGLVVTKQKRSFEPVSLKTEKPAQEEKPVPAARKKPASITDATDLPNPFRKSPEEVMAEAEHAMSGGALPA